jgi:predicted transcriptional regulator
MVERIILLTIQKPFAEAILAGQKVKEFRRRPPKISQPTRTIRVVSVVWEIVGEIILDPASGERTPWGYPMRVSCPRRYSPTLSWESLSIQIPGLRPPQQSYRYLQPDTPADLRLIENLEHYRTQ